MITSNAAIRNAVREIGEIDLDDKDLWNPKAEILDAKIANVFEELKWIQPKLSFFLQGKIHRIKKAIREIKIENYVLEKTNTRWNRLEKKAKIADIMTQVYGTTPVNSITSMRRARRIDHVLKRLEKTSPQQKSSRLEKTSPQQKSSLSGLQFRDEIFRAKMQVLLFKAQEPEFLGTKLSRIQERFFYQQAVSLLSRQFSADNDLTHQQEEFAELTKLLDTKFPEASRTIKTLLLDEAYVNAVGRGDGALLVQIETQLKRTGKMIEKGSVSEVPGTCHRTIDIKREDGNIKVEFKIHGQIMLDFDPEHHVNSQETYDVTLSYIVTNKGTIIKYPDFRDIRFYLETT